jgi:hypothetical protein
MGELVVIVLAFFIPLSALVPGHIASSAILSFITMGNPRHGSHSDVLGNKVFSCKICEDIPIFNTLLFLVLLLFNQLLQFLADHQMHSFEDLGNICGRRIQVVMID